MAQRIKFWYTNHRKEVEEREVEVLSLEYMFNPGFNYAPGWFLRCEDFSRGRQGETRSFALENIEFKQHEGSSVYQLINFAPMSPDFGAKLSVEAKPTSIELTPAEIQSGLDRVRWAEGLIRQLPDHHEGRNSWLLNFGRKANDPYVESDPGEHQEVLDAIEEC